MGRRRGSVSCLSEGTKEEKGLAAEGRGKPKDIYSLDSPLWQYSRPYRSIAARSVPAGQDWVEQSWMPHAKLADEQRHSAVASVQPSSGPSARRLFTQVCCRGRTGHRRVSACALSLCVCHVSGSRVSKIQLVEGREDSFSGRLTPHCGKLPRSWATTPATIAATGKNVLFILTISPFQDR